MEKLPITLVIPTLNRPKSLKSTLDSYFSYEFIPSEIIIIDQSDGEHFEKVASIIDKYSKATLVVHFKQAEKSLTKARNSGIALAQNEFVIFSDDDIVVNKDTLINTYKLLSRKDISMIGGINERSGISKGLVGYLTGFKSFKNRKIGHVTKTMFGRFPIKFKEETLSMWAMGYYFAIKKSLVKLWSLSWDEHLQGYGYAEDLDFSFSYYKKSKINGFKCIYSTSVCVCHMNSQEFRTISRKSTFMYVLHRGYLRNKHNMGLMSKFLFDYNNLVILIWKFFKKDNYRDYRDALIYLKKHKKQVYSGEFYYGE